MIVYVKPLIIKLRQIPGLWHHGKLNKIQATLNQLKPTTRVQIHAHSVKLQHHK